MQLYCTSADRLKVNLHRPKKPGAILGDWDRPAHNTGSGFFHTRWPTAHTIFGSAAHWLNRELDRRTPHTWPIRAYREIIVRRRRRRLKQPTHFPMIYTTLLRVSKTCLHIFINTANYAINVSSGRGSRPLICTMCQTPLHGHRLRTCCTTPPTDCSQQFYNLLYNKFTTNRQKFDTSQHLDISRCWALALRCGKLRNSNPSFGL